MASLATVAVTACAATTTVDVRIRVPTTATLVDQPVSIGISGLQPGGIVTFRVSTRDARGLLFHSSARFRADSSGGIVVGRTPALGGSYTGRDPLAPYWAMTTGAGRSDRFVIPAGVWAVRVEVHVAGMTVAHATFRRRGAANGLARADLLVPSDGLRGVYFAAHGHERAPAVLLLGGSEGGLSGLQLARLLASHGFPTLNLAYFREAGLPAQLANIPLEYFRRGLEWLGARPEVDPDRLTVLGASRGGEAALLVGATFPDLVSGVAAYAPSSMVIRSPNGVDPAWTLGGQAIPSVEPGDHLDNPNPAATIPVERIKGPVLVVSGTEDALWPSLFFGESIVTRRAGRPTAFVRGYAAGHGVGFVIPGVPAFLLGGTRAGDAKARELAWRQLLTMLRELHG